MEAFITPEENRRIRNGFSLKIKNDLLDCTVFWARVVSSENESLFTRYTKHTFYEMQYAIAGKIIMLAGNETPVEVEESDFIIIPPDTYHQIIDGDSVGKRFIMGFSIATEDKRLKRAVECMSAPAPRRETPYMRTLLGLILAKANDASPTCENMLSRLTECLLLEMLGIIYPYNMTENSVERDAGENDLPVDAIYRFICSREGVRLRVSDIARRFNISERHLNRIFVRRFGKSVGSVKDHEKLKLIEMLSASTSLSLNEISELCGFSDEYSMNKFFKRRNLVSVSEYRKTAKKRM